jgi:polar amino acid transport system substrate-binding protein
LALNALSILVTPLIYDSQKRIKHMAKLRLLVICLLVLVVAGTVFAQETELPDLEGATVTVAVENAYPPFNYIDEESGEAIGWDYDTLNEICKRLNCVPEFIETSWDGMIVAVSNGEFDIAADGISITEERKQVVDYSMPYITTIQRFMVRLDEDRFTTSQEFIDTEDYVIGVQTGTTNFDLAQELVGDDRLVSFDTFGATVQALIAGDVDAVIIDDVAGQGYTGVNADEIKLLTEELSSDPLGFIFPPGSELVAAVDAALLSMQEDGTLARISARWGLAAPIDTIADVVVMATEADEPQFTTLLAAVQAAGLAEALADDGATLTVFAPTDEAFAALPEGALEMVLADPELLTRILTYHVIEGAVTSDMLSDMSVATLETGEIAITVAEDGTVMVNDATVITADIGASNGIIHVIDKVLLPADVAEALAGS